MNPSPSYFLFFYAAYAVLLIYALFANDIKKLHRKFSRKYQAKMKAYAEYEKAEMYRNLLCQKLYWLGYEENTYLREDVTSIFESHLQPGEYFRLGDDGSVSSKCNAVNLDEIKKLILVVNEFVTVWFGGRVIRSETLRGCRIIAQCDGLVLAAQDRRGLAFDFFIWEFHDNCLTNGKEVCSDYLMAKEAFAVDILLGLVNLTSDPVEVEWLSALKDRVKTEYEACDCIHEIKEIVSPRWSD